MKTQGKFVNSSLGGTDSARASLTMFSRMITDDFVECSQVSGKTIQSLRIYKDTGDGTELQIDLTDGTSFSCSFSVKPVVEARTGPKQEQRQR